MCFTPVKICVACISSVRDVFSGEDAFSFLETKMHYVETVSLCSCWLQLYMFKPKHFSLIHIFFYFA